MKALLKLFKGSKSPEKSGPYLRKMREARDAQRSGDIVAFAKLSAEAEELRLAAEAEHAKQG